MKKSMKDYIEDNLGKNVRVLLTKEETEMLVLAGLLADESPIPLLKHEIEKCTVTIVDNGVTIEIIYKEEE